MGTFNLKFGYGHLNGKCLYECWMFYDLSA